MLSLSQWLAGTNDTAGERALHTEHYAASAWQHINEKPSSVQFKRNGVVMAAQTVRVDVNSSPSPAESEAGMGAARKLTILGVRGHATVANTDIEKGDRMVLGTTEYTVMSVNDQQVGQIEAYAEAIS